MKLHAFSPFHLISIIGFLKSCKPACDTNGTHEGEAMWLLHSSMNKTASAVLITLLNSDGIGKKLSWSTSDKKRYLTTYQQVINVLQKRDVTDEVNAETESNIRRFDNLQT